MHRMLTAKEVARTIGTSGEYIIRLCERGMLKAQRIDDAWVIWEDDMDAARKEPSWSAPTGLLQNPGNGPEQNPGPTTLHRVARRAKSLHSDSTQDYNALMKDGFAVARRIPSADREQGSSARLSAFVPAACSIHGLSTHLSGCRGPFTGLRPKRAPMNSLILAAFVCLVSVSFLTGAVEEPPGAIRSDDRC